MRYIWKGNISFGLINIPVGLLTASRDQELRFVLLHKKDFSEIRYARICKEEGVEVPYDDLVKGIEREGKLKVVTPEELKETEGDKSHNIEIMTFCDEEEVDPIYFEKPYFLKADKGGEKAYLLLKHGLEKAKKVAITKYVFKNHYNLAVIKPYKNLLVLINMRYHSQILDVKEVKLDDVKFSAQEVNLAVKLIDQLSGHFKPEDYQDEYVDFVEGMLKKKGGVIVKAKVLKKTKKSAKVYDIMELLKESLEKPVRKKRAAKK